MSYNPNKHHRRSIRLKGYDYTQPGAYYITLCTQARQCLFGDVVAGKMRLNSLGYIAFTYWQKIPVHFAHLQLDVFVVMPNHLHGILVIRDTPIKAQLGDNSTTEKFGKPVRGSIPTVIRSYKAAVTKQINLICNTKYTSLIWQRDFYEHINRDEQSLETIRRYIAENPWRWVDAPENPQHYSKHQDILIDLPF